MTVEEMLASQKEHVVNETIKIWLIFGAVLVAIFLIYIVLSAIFDEFEYKSALMSGEKRRVTKDLEKLSQMGSNNKKEDLT